MASLWDREDEFLTVRQVAGTIADDLAYTTVMTILSRLHGKGFVERRREGRAWAYRARLSQTEHAARSMAAAFHDVDDRRGTLLKFVEQLTPEEQQALRDRLARGGP